MGSGVLPIQRRTCGSCRSVPLVPSLLLACCPIADCTRALTGQEKGHKHKEYPVSFQTRSMFFVPNAHHHRWQHEKSGPWTIQQTRKERKHERLLYDWSTNTASKSFFRLGDDDDDDKN